MRTISISNYNYHHSPPISSTNPIRLLQSSSTYLIHLPYSFLPSRHLQFAILLLFCLSQLNHLGNNLILAAQTLPTANSSNNDLQNTIQDKVLATKPSIQTDPALGFVETTPSLNSNYDDEIKSDNNESIFPESSANNVIITDKFQLNLNVTPSNLVANCTDVEFRCEIKRYSINETDTTNLSHFIWWTFKGTNVSASNLPGGRVTNDNLLESVLNIDCAQFSVHNGDYMCHFSIPESGTLDQIDSQNTTLDIYLPLSIQSTDPVNGTVREQVETQANLKCHIFAHPKPKITWQRTDLNTLTVSDIEMDGRILIETKSYPYHTVSSTQVSQPSLSSIESVLSFKSLMRSDNGSYTCKTQSTFLFEKPLLVNFNVIVLEAPEIHIEKLEIENKTLAIVTFIIDYDGNMPIDKHLLEIMNYTVVNSSWISCNIQPNLIKSNVNYSLIQIDNLMPGASYGFRLSAKNEVGQSEWSYMNISVPPDVPSTIVNVHLLSKTNETLLFGWRRPLYDNGGNITNYWMVLKESDNSIISNQTLDINSAVVQSRNSYMYMFRNLRPGHHYNFQVRACSHIGCSNWSTVFDAATSDGHADPPLNIKLECTFDMAKIENLATITWESPTNSRGSIVGYNISLEGYSNYRNANNRYVVDQFQQFYEFMNIDTFKYQIALKPNSNYTVRLCAINKSGCGQFSHITSSSMCQSAPTPPSEFPPNIRLDRLQTAIVNKNNNEVQIAPFSLNRQLMFFIPRVSERNGLIKCYRIIIVRLPNAQKEDNNNSTDKNSLIEQYLSDGPDNIVLSTYKLVHDSRKDSFGAYIAEEFSVENFKSEIVIGDGKNERCYSDALEYDIKSKIRFNQYPIDDNRSPRRISYDVVNNGKNEELNSSLYATNLVEDGELQANTNYTGFVEVTVLTWNKTILVARGPFVEPIETEPSQLIIPELSKSSLSETANGILFGTICGLLLVLVLLFSVLCFLKRKATETPQVILEDERIGLTSIIRRTIGVKRKSSIFNHLNSTHSIKKWASTPVPIQSLVTLFQERHANSDFLFQAEFESLPESFPDRTTNHCDAPENVSKNRYPDIKSYDQTRVVLNKIDDIVGSDYINADLVSGYKGQKQFICAQGPIQKTIGDFWRMVYEQKCSIIVMLTGIEEQGRIKCAQYWNDSESIDVTENLQITPVCCREYSDYLIRRFSLKDLKSGEVRDVLHFHFVAWKDFLAPEQPSWLLRFIKRVNEHHCPDRGPILVHCSAGVGRTGTFIAIDTLISEINDGATHVNVFQCVSQLRHQRNYLVQSVKQYIFVYRAIMEFVEFGDTEIEASHLVDQYKQLKEPKFDCGSGIMMEFEKLNEVLEDNKSCIVGLMDMNRPKNRYDFIIPYDVNRVILTPSSSKDHSYINASFIQGYDHILSFIVAQDPMEQTVNEFWLMIVEHNVTTLVMLAELGEGQSKCHCYWPADEFDCDYVKVKLIEEEMSQYYTKRVFCITHKKTNNSHNVNQYQFLSWKSGVVPESTISLITLINVVFKNCIDNQSSNSSSTSSPILVHCSGGGDRSSVFVAFASLVKQLRLDERVDIFQTARFTRSQRQCMLKTIAQYDFLYRCVIDYIDFHNIFNNGDTQL